MKQPIPSAFPHPVHQGGHSWQTETGSISPNYCHSMNIRTWVAEL